VFIPVVDPETFRSATAPQYRDAVGKSGMTSYVMVPMRARGKVVGALGAGRLADAPRFTIEDLDVIQKLADQAALAMATWDAFRLLEREKDAASRSERRFRTLADHAPDMIARLDGDGRYRYVNPRFASNMGVAADRFLGRTNHELGFPKEFCRVWDEKLPEAFSGSEVLMDFEFPGPDGARQYQAKLVPEPGADGNVRTVIGMARDVTELTRRVRRNEEAFRSIGSMAERLRGTADVDLLLDTLVVDAMKLVGAEGGCAGLRTPAGMTTKRYFRHGDIQPLDYTWAAGEGLPGWLIQHRVPYVTNDAASDPQIVQALCRTFGVWSALSMPILDGEGEVIGFFELHNKRDRTPFTDEDRQRLSVISHTASVALQSALAMRRAQHAERQERAKAAELGELVNELETFAYSVAHDLRAPVRAMDGYSQILLEDYGPKLGSHGRALAERITESSRRMDHMIRDLLAYSRLSRDEVVLQPVALQEAVPDAVDQLRGEVNARHAEITVDRPLPLVIAHPAVLRQVIVNLLSNAMKFVAPGIHPRVRVRSESSGAAVRLWVEDNGIGIAPEYHERLFRVFERLHGPDAYPGTGIGLAIVRRGIERMGGSVGVESQVGAGSRFWLELPAAAPESDQDPHSSEETHVRND
jgi:PAS domain S-box-containing protein